MPIYLNGKRLVPMSFMRFEDDITGTGDEGEGLVSPTP